MATDSEFIEQEAQMEYHRQQMLLHVMSQQQVIFHALKSALVLPEEMALFANVYEKAAAVLRDQQAQCKPI